MKIDRSFVTDADSERLSNPAIVNIILQLARILGIAVIAEGIESARPPSQRTPSPQAERRHLPERRPRSWRCFLLDRGLCGRSAKISATD